MKRNAIIFGICITSVLFLFRFQVAQAAIMETTYILEIDRIITAEADAFWDIGNQFQVSVVYDDEGSESHRYTDGSNGIGEFGSGDDGLLYNYDCTGLEFCSDAVFTFDSNLIDYFGSFDNTTIINTAYVSYFPPYLDSYYLKDGVNFYVADNGNDTSYGYIQKGFSVGETEVIVFNTQLFFDIVESTTSPLAPVPEPATMLLFGTGLAGLAGYRRRKAMKK